MDGLGGGFGEEVWGVGFVRGILRDTRAVGFGVGGVIVWRYWL